MHVTNVTAAAAGRHRGFIVASRNHLIMYVACLVAPYTTRGYSPYRTPSWTERRLGLNQFNALCVHCGLTVLIVR